MHNTDTTTHHAEPGVLLAPLAPQAPARVTRPVYRKRLTVPAMPHRDGLGCCWNCLPDSIEPECALHGTNGDMSLAAAVAVVQAVIPGAVPISDTTNA